MSTREAEQNFTRLDKSFKRLDHFESLDFNQRNESTFRLNSSPICGDHSLPFKQVYFIQTSTLNPKHIHCSEQTTPITRALHFHIRRKPLKNPTSSQKCAYNSGHWTSVENNLFYEGCQRYGWSRWKKIHQHFLPSRSLSQIRSHAQKVRKNVTQRASIKKNGMEAAANSLLELSQRVIWALSTGGRLERKLPILVHTTKVNKIFYFLSCYILVQILWLYYYV